MHKLASTESPRTGCTRKATHRTRISIGRIQWLGRRWSRPGRDGPVEFVESFKNDTFKNQVFVYTPKGELRELPVGASPLDFAYRIHTDVGHVASARK